MIQIRTKISVAYEEHARGSDHCSACEHFKAPDRCDRVGGSIAPEGWCRLFKEKKVAHISAAKRKSLPASDFALSKGHYPDDTKARARNALSRISEFGTPAEKAKVRRAVKRKYPSIKVSSGKKDLVSLSSLRHAS